MKERREIVERWHQGAASVLATLVRVQGSSYRQAGARMLLCKDGSFKGGISAGCLEADLLRKASWLVRNGAVTQRYSTLLDESGEIPFGLGCGGVLDILLEPAESPETSALLTAIERSLAGHEQWVATWLPSSQQKLRRAIFSPEGQVLFSSAGLSPESVSQGRTMCRANAAWDLDEVFAERLLPPQRLFVFGAGDDAKPLVTMASLLGWDVSVIDGRTHLARETRFPETHGQVTADLRTAIPTIESRDAVVLMTHSYEQDRDCLASILQHKPRYLGLLGSRRRSSLLIRDAANQLDWTVSECCARISAPAGLEIGAEGPEAIALAILAEAQACCMGKGDESRKLSALGVEGYLADGAEPEMPQVACSLGLV